MDKEAVYDAVVTQLEDNWDTYKPSGAQSLAPVGDNRKGVYQGYPIIIHKYPCLGIMPAHADHELIASQGQEAVVLRLTIYFYAFHFKKSVKVSRMFQMDKTIVDIIASDRTLGGRSDVDLTYVSSVDYGEYIRRQARGPEVIAVGGEVEIVVQQNRCYTG